MIALPVLITQKLEEANYKFLGWANGWKFPYPDEYINCVAQDHQVDSVQHTRSGSENTYSCDICKYYYKVDSSD